MKNLITIIKGEIAFLPKEFKKLIKLYSDKVEDYLKDAYYFQDIEEMINDEDMNVFSKLNFEYFNLAEEFRNFILRYNINHDDITESALNDIIKRPIEYILHKRQSAYDTDSEETDSETDSEDEDKTDNNLKEQLMIDNNLQQSMINNILKD